jgi:hypothetical protein
MGTPSTTSGYAPEGNVTQLPGGQLVPLAANVQAGGGQILNYDASGNAVLMDGTVPGQYVAGEVYPGLGFIGANPSTAGQFNAGLWQGFGGHTQVSTGAGDAFTASSVSQVAWGAAGDTIGALSRDAFGNNRSLVGIVSGLYPDGTPRFWTGQPAQIVGRALHSAENSNAGRHDYPADVSASTDQGSLTGGAALLTIGFLMLCDKTHKIITGVEIIPTATQAAAGTNYRVIQLWKLDTTGVVPLASSPLVATFTTATQGLVVGQPTQFALSGTVAGGNLVMVETDILVGTSIHQGSGVALPLSGIRALAKVL